MFGPYTRPQAPLRHFPRGLLASFDTGSNEWVDLVNVVDGMDSFSVTWASVLWLSTDEMIPGTIMLLVESLCQTMAE